MPASCWPSSWSTGAARARSSISTCRPPRAQICEARAKARGLRNIQFLTGSLLDLPSMPIGQFDYIDCTGVLHHLPDPAAGMRALASVLQPDGGVGVMLYGEYGRSGVYPLQEMLRTLAPPSMALEDRHRHGQAADPLPADHQPVPPQSLPQRPRHRRRCRSLRPAAAQHATAPSPCPRSAPWRPSAGLRVVAFLEPVRYEPATYMSDPIIARQASSLPLLERAAFAERLAGNLRTHVFYATRAGFDTVARPEDTSADPGAARDGCAEARRRPAARLAAGRQPRRLPVARATAGAGAAHHRADRRPQDGGRDLHRAGRPGRPAAAGRISTPSSRTSTSS